MEQMSVNFSFRWTPILYDVASEYSFPDPISDFMKKQYRVSAVYRWVIYEEDLISVQAIYIGEAQILCPNRLNNYLRPGPSQQTSKRIHALLKEHIAQGRKVRMEHLDFEDITLHDFKLHMKDFSLKSMRRFVEELFVTFYRLNGMKVLNL